MHTSTHIQTAVFSIVYVYVYVGRYFVDIHKCQFIFSPLSVPQRAKILRVFPLNGILLRTSIRVRVRVYG